jgi:hypothetical protein
LVAEVVCSLPVGGSVRGVTVAHDTRPSGHQVKTATVGLGTCESPNVSIRVAVAHRSYAPSQPVDVLAVVRNRGKQVCTYSGTGRGNQYIGPCGAIAMSVIDSGGAPVWPGPVAYSCPMMSATDVAPGQRVIASGSWPKVIVTRARSSAAPSGTYRLVIADTVSFVIRLR